MKFSQRIGKVDVPTTVQADGMTNELRNGLWNAIMGSMPEDLRQLSSNCYASDLVVRFFTVIWRYFWKKPVDAIHLHTVANRLELRDLFFECEWYTVYDFIEFLLQHPKTNDCYINKKALTNNCNAVLKEELSAWRIVENELVKITDDVELKSLQAALSSTKGTRFAPVEEHLRTASRLLFDRKAPDPRNSIKESISAIEAIAAIITGKSDAILGQALKQLEQGHGLHPALKKAFSSLYGYTSDAGGIRHALIDEADNCDVDDAKYMLITCTAFVNYLLAKQA